MAATWVQKVKPNTNDKTLYVYNADGKVMTDWYGWCLAVTQQAFGIKKRLYASAIEAWNKNTTKHTGGGMTIPIGMYVPVFYKGGQYGHIVIAYRDAYDHVKVWSSPYTHKAYFDTFEGPVVSTLDGVGKKYGGAYVGWSETLTETRIIQWENIPEPTTPKTEPTPVPEPEPTPVIKWTDLAEQIGLFSVRNTWSIELATGKKVQSYATNTKINFVQETTYDGEKYYRTSSARDQGLDVAFKADDFVAPEPETPAPSTDINSNTQIPSENTNNTETKDDSQQGVSGQSSEQEKGGILAVVIAFLKKILSLLTAKKEK